jgi:hypothetical protein
MGHSITAFADEFGNNSFKFDTQGTHFIVATVICKNSNLGVLKEAIDQIRLRHNFQTGEIKSSNVAQNHTRRKKILRDIAKLDISVFAVIVDKRQLFGKGFGYKKSFYKYLNGLLYKELFRTFPKLELYVDEHGGNDFLMEFKWYVERNHERSLFSGSEFTIVNSQHNHYIQLADFIAGSLGYIHDESKKSEHSAEFEEILKPIISSVNFFPREYSFRDVLESNIDQSFDPKIAEVSYLRIQDFLEKESGTDQQKIDQIHFLKLLMLLQRASVKNRYITSKEIFGHMNQSRQVEIREEYFRTKVVGALRDKGVLIASGRDGYKIPTCSKDLTNFVKHGKRIILPMINRIKEAREAIKLATGNELDLLSTEDLVELRRLLDK